MSRLTGSLVAAGVSKSYGAEPALTDVGLVVPPRARIGLVGPTEYSGGWSEYEAERVRRRDRHHRRWEASVTERRRIEEQARRMAEWERRGYGQGRKKKKSKDVKRTYGAKLARVETVEKPYEPWELP